MLLPDAAALAAPLERESITPRRTFRGRRGELNLKNFSRFGVRPREYCGNLEEISLAVHHIGLGAVAAGGGFGVPFAVGGLVLDRCGAPGPALFGGDAPGGGNRCSVGRKWFRKHAIDG